MAPMDVMTAALASGYHGPPQLTPQRAFTEWTLDPWALAIAALLAGLYLAGVRRVRRSGRPWPAGRVVVFCGVALGFWVIATMSWVAVYTPPFGWLEFDPTNNVWVGTDHIAVAWGRDFGDVSPLHGVILGGAEHELTVSVSVDPITP